MKILGTIVLCGALLFVAPAAFADTVRTDWNHQVNFEQFHTYSWGDVKISDPFDVHTIKSAIDSQLQKKGWQELPSGGQVTISVIDGVHNEKEAETYYDGLGGGWGGGWGWRGWGGGWGLGGFGESQTQEVNVPQGHMVIDMFNSENKQLIWRGISQGEVKSNPDKERKTMDGDIHKMLNSFPPKSK